MFKVLLDSRKLILDMNNALALGYPFMKSFAFMGGRHHANLFLSNQQFILGIFWAS